MVLVENSSTPLNNGETYTTNVYDAYKYPSYVVSLKTDQNGEIKHYFSPDGFNWDHEITEQYTASQAYFKSDEVRARYYKFSFENNSGSNQTYFRSQVQFNEVSTVVKVDETLADLDIRPLTKETDSITISQGNNNIYVRVADSAGQLIYGTNNALNVQVQNSDLDIRNLDKATDSITCSQGTNVWYTRIADGNGNFLNSTSNALNVNVENASLTVSGGVDVNNEVNIRALDSTTDNITVLASDLDIRDLSSGTDSVSAVQSGTWNVTVDNASLTVSSTDLDIRDLSSSSDSVSAVQSGNWNVRLNDGIGNSLASIDGSLAVFNVASVGDSFYRNLDVGLTASQVNAGSTYLYSIVATNQHATNARYLKLYNESTTPDENNTPIYTLALFPQTTQVINYATPQEISNGLYLRCSGAIADNDTTSISANDCIVNIQYIDRS